jgi:hypothetical protein
MRHSNLTEMSDFNVTSMQSWGTASVQIQDSKILSMADHSYEGINQTAIYASDSILNNIEMVSISNCKSGMSLFQSSIGLIKNLTIND